MPTIAISQVPWLSRVFALPSVKGFLQKPQFDARTGKARGLTAFTLVS
jgi:hypothetical protein